MPLTRSRSSSPNLVDHKKRRTHSHRLEDEARNQNGSQESSRRNGKDDNSNQHSSSHRDRDDTRRKDRRDRSTSNERSSHRDKDRDRNRSDRDRRRHDDRTQNRDRRRSRSRDRDVRGHRDRDRERERERDRWNRRRNRRHDDVENRRRSRSPEERIERDERRQDFPVTVSDVLGSTAPSDVPSIQPTSLTHSSALPPGTPVRPEVVSQVTENGHESSAAGSAMASAETPEQQKLRLKRERLEQWKAKKALEEGVSRISSKAQSPIPSVTSNGAAQDAATANQISKTRTGSLTISGVKDFPKRPAALATDEATAAALAAAAISARLGTAPPPSLPPASLVRNTPLVGIKGLPAKPSFTPFQDVAQSNPRIGSALGTDDDGSKQKIQKLEFEAIQADDDLLKLVEAEEDSDEEDLVDGGHVGYNKRKIMGEDPESEAAVKPENSEEAERSAESGTKARISQVVEEATKKRFEAVSIVKQPTAASRLMEIDEEEIDPLDAYMSGVTEEVTKVNASDKQKMSQLNLGKKVSLDEDEDYEEEQPLGSDDEIDKTDLRPEDILALAAKKVKKKDLAPVDHSKIDYEPFRKAFYHPPAEVEEMSDEQAENIRIAMDGIKIRGQDCPKPVMKWSWFGLHAACLDVIKNLGYPSPTPIQGQAVPAIMSGRDVIGVAKTGSGKTLAFLLPMLRHIKDQRPLEPLEGPIAMIMTPTRELATQIYKEGRPFLKALGLRAACAYGGSPLKDNIADMKRGAEVTVCTPGRMIELLTTNSGRVINMRRVTYLVLDEADRMFDMGFEPQVMKIVNQIRPDRQTVLFSATFPKQMEALARKILRKPLEITVGGRSVVAAEIEQIVEVREEPTKFNRLLEILGRSYNEDSESRSLVFVDRQESADNLFRDLLKKGYPCLSLHGGKEQVDRDQVIADFKAGVTPIVVATSVAARGLDVKQLKLVINYDAPNHMEDYVHRAGRTGRAGNKGTCITFITPDQDRYAVDLLRALVASGAKYPEELKNMSDSFLEKVKSGKAQASGSGFGGKGLDRLEKDRDAKSRAERSAYGEPGGEDGAKEEGQAGASTTAGTNNNTSIPISSITANAEIPEINVEVRRGPAPDSSRRTQAAPKPVPPPVVEVAASPATTAALKAAQEAAQAKGLDASGIARAQSVVADLNAKLRSLVAAKNAQAAQAGNHENNRSKDPDATDFHAIVPINDYPQKARWKVTNKETMVQLVESTGASVTNKGIFYDKGKEPGPDDPPKLHLLVESNEEWRVQRAITEIKHILIEATTQALEAESRNPGQAAGRYSVLG
ncbi:P-loop containing nucleoside triphosphate hydrolase protein [Phakopsora pachyrhizi]|uniref:RNA helicase n=1 Tax=Phakopsora pachyrhizi TaxID=170000 RepID=A0AAV0B8Y1_PHAPC|nr:P-loop containing nucleoside triphosphate hydrolase protein [Phakopsora pachyrhizi]